MEIGRNSIIVRNVDLNSDSFRKVNARFSLWDKVYHKYDFSVFKVINNDLFFPGSIGKNTIKSYFPNEEEVSIVNLTAKSENIEIELKNNPKDDLQTQAVSFLLKMKKDSLRRERLLSLPTDSGKTYIAINFITQLKKKAMIIVDTLDLAAQWKREFQKHTSLKEDDILILSGKDSVERELKSENKKKVYIAIHRTLSNLIDEDIKFINNLMNSLKIGIRIFDEFHVEYKNTCQINALSNVEYTVFLSATPNRSDFIDDSLFSRVFRNVPFFNGKELSKRNYQTIILTKFNSGPSLDTKLSIKTKYGFSAAKWAKFISEESYETLFDHIEKIFEKFDLLKRKQKVAIILPTIKLIKKMKEDLENELKVEVGEFIGEIKKEKRKEEFEKEIVLTNDKIFGKGIDVQNLDVLINCVPLASLVKTEQILGRLRYREGRSSILIDVTDYGFDECIKQLKVRKRFFKKKAKKIIEID